MIELVPTPKKSKSKKNVKIVQADIDHVFWHLNKSLFWFQQDSGNLVTIELIIG